MNENMEMMEVETTNEPTEEATVEITPVQEVYEPMEVVDDHGLSTGTAMLIGGGIAIGAIALGKFAKKKFKKSKLWHKIKTKVDEPDEDEIDDVIDEDVEEEDSET